MQREKGLNREDNNGGDGNGVSKKATSSEGLGNSMMFGLPRDWQLGT